MDSRPFVQASREIRERMVRFMDSLSALAVVSHLDAHRPSEPALIREALNALIQHEDLARCSVFLRQDNQLINAAGLDWDDLLHGDGEDAQPRVRGAGRIFRVGEGILGEAAATGQMVHCRDTRNDPRFADRSDAPAAGSIMSVPMLIGTGVIGEADVLGVLNISHPQPEFFNEWHERVLTVFAAILAQLLHNHRLHRKMEEEVQRRTRALDAALQEAHSLRQRYETLSIVDDLTELHNRRFFFPEADAAVSRATRHKYAFSLMLVDLDHFKHVNDSHGHQAGDRVLHAVARYLLGRIRQGDILARYGGEEFILAMPHTPPEGAMVVADSIRAGIAELAIEYEGTPLAITASIGATTWDGSPPRSSFALLEQLIQQADLALYFCKNHGRNRTHLYSPATRDMLPLGQRFG